MANLQTDEPSRQKPLRLWPGVAIVMLLLLARFVVPVFMPEATPYGVMGALVGGVALVVWWVFFSRAPWSERLGAIGLMMVALAATPFFVHKSIATGAMGMLFYVLAIPVLSLAFVAWAVATRHLSNRTRRAAMVATILLACGVWMLVRTGGFTGNFDNDLKWRWSETAEERLLAKAGDKPTLLQSAPAAVAAEADWPGFRGPERDGVIRGVRIETDWSASPPVELWRRPIGPGWSSFAVSGDLLYTQEQRGDDEVVACYNVTTGEPVWRHRDAARFWESNAGAGPRATPTLKDGRVYTFGATGILNVLDADDGTVVWSRNAASDTDTEVPGWGFASSPLVVDDVVIVAAAGQLVAYDLATGDPRWFGPAGGVSYSSPHLLTIDGVAQILLLNGAGATSVAPGDGTLLWEHPWPGSGIVQPALTADGDVLISALSASGGIGVRRVAVAHGPAGWTIEERWTSNRLKPYFNDFVIHDGHAFGFDGSILACIEVEDGKRKWKGGRYGHGQLVLLADQDVLLVLSERGELALVAAAPDQFTELARFPAIEGKTWNHPVLVDDVLLVRNGREMAAFRLSLTGG
ncbi:MAG: PQQ-binding-like beta-propeller repeat protein [Phycisphaerae bacterium]|nr:PQQ-binding-like beta-propeller repeat protein [Phycisphaerae bacterium]NIU10378.1 PQQ-binding-like beta-propeller repeat protein [Phycisphaerae bacterium]NIW10798.1 PQQ-binding-like beta-propeller repeat protein [Gammaproteobacteria bacterium]NIX29931.1 PQQ-binding-like beta-propeller repeat protein [Phycisphaerae bacterium]